MKWTKEEEELLIKSAINMNVVDLQKTLFSYRTINSVRERVKKFKLKYQNVDYNYFNKDNQNSNYILGYWLADGYISKKCGGLYFSIGSVDLEHLSKIKYEMNIKTNILFKSDNKFGELIVGNKLLVNNLLKLGGEFRKTKTITFEKVKYNNSYFYDFLRGFFDGDGSIMIQNKKYFGGIKFTGSKLIMYSLYNILSKEYKCRIYEDVRKEKSDCFYVQLCGQGAKDVLTKMYENSELYLNRKYEKYLIYVKNKSNLNNYKNK